VGYRIPRDGLWGIGAYPGPWGILAGPNLACGPNRYVRLFFLFVFSEIYMKKYLIKIERHQTTNSSVLYGVCLANDSIAS
jgi:hypothetical protein